jgi:ubiquinone/menaquinone biosynthesis C-methylase UbiE
VDDLDIQSPADGLNPAYTTPSVRTVKLDLFATSLLFANTYKKYLLKMGLQGNERVLDFGSGSGASAIHLAGMLDKGGELTCFDISETWMKVVRHRLKGYGQVKFILGDITRMELPGQVFDVILVHFVLHEIDPPIRPEIIKRLYSVLKDGGTLFIREPSNESHGMKGAEFRKLLTDQGFRETGYQPGRAMILFTVNEGIYKKEKPEK